jgi:acyl-CoA thioester hydrolase
MAPFTHSLRVRYHECDPQGIVFFGTHLAYFDTVLTELWRAAFGSYDAMVESGSDVMVVSAAAGYRAPARFDDELDFDARLTRLGETAMSTRIDAATNGQPVVQGDIRHVFIDPATKTKRPMPEHIRTALEPYLEG